MSYVPLPEENHIPLPDESPQRVQFEEALDSSPNRWSRTSGYDRFSISQDELEKRERRRTREENYRTISTAIDIIKHAGDPRYQHHPLEALEKLKEADECLYAPIPSDLVPSPVELHNKPVVSSKVRGYMANPDYAAPQRVNINEHPAARIVNSERPLPSLRFDGTKKDKFRDIQSRIKPIFEAGNEVAEAIKPPPDNRRVLIKARQEEQNALRPRGGRSTSNSPTLQKSPIKVPQEFVPRVATIVKHDSPTRREEVEQHRQKIMSMRVENQQPLYRYSPNNSPERGYNTIPLPAHDSEREVNLPPPSDLTSSSSLPTKSNVNLNTQQDSIQAAEDMPPPMGF